MNDPVGIALMIGVIELATEDDGDLWIVAREFAVEMAVGLVVGVVWERCSCSRPCGGYD